MRFFLKAGIVLFIVFAVLCILNRTSKTIVSPDKTKAITIYRPISLFWYSRYYIVKGEYNGLFSPDTNYALFEPKGMCFINVNWEPSEHNLYLKIACSSGYIKNRFKEDVFMSPNEGFDNYLDNNEQYYYPKYGSYILSEIIRN